jgi:TonB-linked SusC/RagA family outer membrane protein
MIFLSTATVLAANPSRGQGLDQEIVIGMNHENLEALIKKIEAVSDFTSAYYSSAFEPYNDITFEPAKRTIREALDLGFRGTGLEYTVKGRVIVVGNKGSDGLDPLVSKDGRDVTVAPIRVTGTVKDVDGIPLPGVNVLVKGTTVGTSTDANGDFALDAPEASRTIVFSFVGLKTIEMTLDGRTKFEVAMESDVATLKEVEISGGYYTTTNKAKTGSIVKVSSKDIERQPVTSPLMALQGRVPGLEITPNSGVAGSAVKVVIRGRNTLRNTTREEVANGPLFIIDGIPIDSNPVRSGSFSKSTISQGYDPLSTLNPANIESMEILKDADATAIYGSRGANGVIIITTKKGKQQGRTSIDASAYTGIGKIVNRLDLLDTEQYQAIRKEAFENDGVEPGMFDVDVNGIWDKNRYTDWQEVLLGGRANINDIQTGISGGNGNTSFKLDGGFHKETVIYPGEFGFHRVSGSFSLNHISPNQKFSVTASVNYGSNNSKIVENNNFISQALTLAPNAPALYDEDGNLNWQVADFGFAKLTTFDNPLAKLKNTNESKNGNIITNGVLSYAVIPGLVLKTNIGFTELNGKELMKFPLAALDPRNITANSTGRNVFGRNNRQSWIVEPQVTYAKKVGDHSFNILLGTTWQESITDYQSIEGYGYLSDALLNNLKASTSTAITTDFSNQYKYMAYFTRIGYDWNGKYLMSLTGRRDGSSRFGPGRQLGNFGAVGIAWIVSNESFIKDNVGFLSFAKIRGSHGITGSDQIGDYKFYNTYQVSAYPYNGMSALSPTSLYNPDYGWEVTRKTEAAIELGFFDDQISLEIGRYHNVSSNQLVNYQLPVMTGFGQVVANLNAATVENEGWEAMLNVSPVQTSKFKWTVSFNVSLNRNKLVSFPGIEESPYSTLYQVGEPLSLQRLYVYKGINPKTGAYEMLDVDNDGSTNQNDLQLNSPTDSKYYGGINNILSFKSFDLSFLFQFVSQRKMGYNPGLPGVAMNMPTKVLDHWRTEGDISDVGKLSQNFINAFYYASQVSRSSYGMEDASFLRLKTLSCSYTLPSMFSEKIKVQQFRVFIQCQNLFTITKYSGFDPETGSGLPPLKMVTVGFQSKF